MIQKGIFPDCIPAPESFESYTNSVGGLLGLPTTIQGCSVVARKLNVRLTVGTGGAGFLRIVPNLAGSKTSPSYAFSTGSWTGTSVPSALVVGSILQQPLDPTSPWTESATFGSVSELTKFWTPHFTMSLKVNSSAVTNKKGRLYIGVAHTEELSGATGNELESYQSFQSWNIDQVSQSAMPRIQWIPTTSFVQDANVDPFKVPSIVVFTEGMDAQDVLEFEVNYASVVTSFVVPWAQPLFPDTDAIQLCVHALKLELPRGFTVRDGAKQSVAKKHIRAVAVQETKTQPLLSRVLDVGKELLGNSSIKNIIGKALNFLPKLFG
jgi:hypothetical protein